MNAEIITIGDELLIGQVIDTNSAWLGQQLTFNGIRVKQKTAVSDDPGHIKRALDEAKTRAEIILLTGGLGPTKDDLTKVTLTEYFGMKLQLDESVLNDITELFRRFGRDVTDTNRTQAEVPDGCEVIKNPNGTAPGMWFDRDGKIFVSMPGVPYEMKAMFSENVLPKLRERFDLPAIYHRTVMTQGIGESWLSDTLEVWEASLKTENIGLAYLPSPGMVRLRLTGYGPSRSQLRRIIDTKIEELHPLIGKYIFATEDTTLPIIVGKMLSERQQTIATAESCTGGYIAHLITAVPGSSAYYLGSTLTYAYEIKTSLLGIPQEMMTKHGAVSEEVVKAMAKNVREKLGSDYSISTSGIAGPTGGTPDKPVGTIWIAVASKDGVEAKMFQFGDNRERNIERTAQAALMMLRNSIAAQI
ncbi:MAG TPA: competence/damage-inducible protein A [Bacteroidia bacterium]|nr:competence/damage-inducible protein A [Bacteroidia bacterium]